MGKRNADVDHFNNSPAKRIKVDAAHSDTTKVSPTSPVCAAFESPGALCGGQEFALRRDLVDGAVLTDLTQKRWRVGKPIGKGSFGEIFLASDDCSRPVASSAEYVVKIEPHSNGPLFVEIHCLINAGKPLAPATRLPPGMPAYIASGSHYFNAARYRFLILRRYQCDLRALVEQRQLDAKSLLCVAVQIVDVLEHLHDRGYAHSDIKAENLMLGSSTFERSAVRPVDMERVRRVDEELQAILKAAGAAPVEPSAAESTSTTSSSQEVKASAKSNAKAAKASKRTTRKTSKRDESSSESVTNGHAEDSNSSDYVTPPPNDRKRNAAVVTSASTQHQQLHQHHHHHHGDAVEFSGTNPMRACRRTAAGANPTYQDMLSSHYLRPQRRKVDYGLSDDSDASGDTDAGNSEAKADKDFVPATLKSPKSSTKAAVAASALKRTGRPRKLLQKLKLSDDEGGDHSDAKPSVDLITEDRIHLIDFGLAIKFIDSSGQHRPFCMDARRAHDGTLEFTSRDAHMGAHSRRSDLECFGFNLLYWTQGWLPWKDEQEGGAAGRCSVQQQQPEQVHRIKELFMTDVAVMFRHIYGREVPVWIGQFMRYVGTLAYHDRPDYELCRNMFRAELQRMGVDVSRPAEMRLCAAELRRQPVRKWPVEVKLEDGVDGGAENLPGMQTPAAQSMAAIATARTADVHKSMMKLGLLLAPLSLPFREVTSAGQNRISPKNLRSKSEKQPKQAGGDKRANGGAQSAVFSWTEILSTDPDQIARQRAEKEFDRDPADTPLCQRYKGKPTYAILEVQNRLKFKDKLIYALDETPNGNGHRSSTASVNTSTAHKRNPTSSAASAAATRRRSSATAATETPTAHFAAVRAAQAQAQSVVSTHMLSPERRKSGLRTALRHTPKSKAYRDSMLTKQRQRAAKRSALTVPHSEFSTSADEESSLSSASSSSSSTTATTTCSSRAKRAAKQAATAKQMELIGSDDDDDDDDEDDVDEEEEEQVDEDDDDVAEVVKVSRHRRTHRKHHHQPKHRSHRCRADEDDDDDGDDGIDDVDDETSRDTIDYSPIKTRRRRRQATTTKLAPVSEEPAPAAAAAAIVPRHVPASSVMQRKAAMRATQQMALSSQRDASSRHCKY